ECSSYRPISVLDLDLKLIAKILASRLGKILPSIINSDQTGFIRGRYSSHNVRRLLNIMQHSYLYSPDALVISLDAEKAFDRLEWPYLFLTLSKFGVGEGFVKWVQILYTSPLSTVITNGLRTKNFHIGHGTRQGCPMSALLFAIAMEPLAAAIRQDISVRGVTLNNCQHKISLYADDVLLYLDSPTQDIPKLIQLINEYGSFSGYKINFSKSEAMPLNNLQALNPAVAHPFRWSPAGFTCLDIKISSNLKDLCKLNYAPLLQTIKQDLERWSGLRLSLLGRIHLIKMDVLPRLLYFFQMLPTLLSKKTLAQLNSAIISFTWHKKRPRLRYSFLSLPHSRGGLAAPSLKNYQLAAQLKYILVY
ncbi:hypothetical protein LDENG_00086010, partial [Lucifuga dentata]